MFESQDFVAASDYMVAWAVYGAAAAVLLGVGLWVTRRWQRDLRWLVLGLLAILLLMPAPVPEASVQAPVISFLALGALSGHNPELLAPVLVKLALSIVVLVVAVVAHGVWWRRRRPAAARRPAGR